MRFALLVLLFCGQLLALERIDPAYSLQASGLVQSIYYEPNRLYAGTSSGTVDIFDLSSKERIKQVVLPKIKDFMGDEVPAKIYSIDKFADRLLIVSQGMKGYRNLWIYEDGKLEKKIDISRHWFMVKAAFVDGEHLLIGLLSNQLVLYDLAEQKPLYIKQMSYSSFSDFALAKDGDTYASTDESGVVHLVQTDTGAIQKELKGQNVDRAYQVDYKNGVVLTAGQDRRAAVYKRYGAYYLQFDFLLYACALSPKAQLAAVAYNEQNDILIFDVGSKEKLYDLKGQNATMTQILFTKERSLFSASDDRVINFWRLP